MASSIRPLQRFLSTVLGCGLSVAAPANSTEKSSAAPPMIVVGFMGGWVRRDNLVHSGVQMAARLRAEYGPGAHVEVFEGWSMGVSSGAKAHGFLSLYVGAL